MNQTPIRIAGGGIAGLTTAIRLAQQGIHVEVFEKQRDSGVGLQTRYDVIENWTTLTDFPALLCEQSFDLGTHLHTISQVELYDFNGICYPLKAARPLFYLIKRGAQPDSLEQRLKAQALDLGVELCYGEALRRDQADVWAVGSGHRGFFLSAGLTFRTSHADALKIRVDTRLAPKAYTYFVVVEGQATLAVVLTREFKQARSRLAEAVAAFQRIQPFEMRDVHASAGFGGRIGALIHSPISVGEAAGFQDYLWGFGIRHALLSGMLAARAIAEGIAYEPLVAQEVTPLVQSSLINRIFYDHVNNYAYRALIRRFSTTQNLNRLLYRCYRSRSMRALLWPLARRHYAGGG